MSAITYDWLKSLPKDTFAKFPPSLFSELALPDLFLIEKALSENLSLEDVHLELSPLNYTDSFEIKKNEEVLQFIASGFSGTASLVLLSHELEQFLFHLMGDEKGELSSYVEPDLLKGFRPFFYSHIAAACNKGFKHHNLSFQWSDSQDEITLPTAFISGKLHFEGGNLSFKLILSDLFLKSLQEKSPTSSLLNSPLASEITFPLHFQVGKVSLPKKDYLGISKGDFLVLDSCLYQSSEAEHKFIVTLAGKPLFRAKQKENGVKLLEYPLFEENAPMAKRPIDEEEHEETEMEDSTFLDTTHDEDHDEEEESIAEDEPTQKEEEEEDEEEEEQEIAEAEQPSEPSKPKTLEKLSFEELPLEISVEIGRLQMPLKEIMGLRIGSLIPLNIPPNREVDLVVKEKTIARGELLKVGDLLGVRITALPEGTGSD